MYSLQVGKVMFSDIIRINSRIMANVQESGITKEKLVVR